MKKIFVFAITITLLLSCKSGIIKNEKPLEQENLVTSTIWFQRSPEAKALFYQGFNLAKTKLLEYSKVNGTKPKAVVVDLDETMIDNSPFQGKLIETGKSFTPETWSEWVKKEEATAMPGAIDFSHFCKSLGIEVIFISNRTVGELEPTMNNMLKLGFAYVKPENFFLKEDKSGKEPRRELVSQKFDIVLLLGDNLNDLAECFENRGDDWGAAEVEKNKDIFGNRFIVFPNPMYGEWEKNIYGKQRITDEQIKFDLRRAAIKSY
jgi:5'-nucleotidase (lipoprotein e(P4) family)